MSQTVTRKEPWLFFLPLIAMTEMMQISHSMVHAFLARLTAPKVILAAYNAAFSANVPVASLQFAAPIVAIAFVKDRLSLWRLVRFYWAVTALPLAALVVLGVTPLGAWLFGGVLGASPEAQAQAQAVTLVLALNSPVVIFRNIASGLIMLNRKTLLITVATIVRLTSLLVFLVLTSRLFDGAIVGGLSLVACMWMETAFMLLMARGFYTALPERQGEPTPYLQYFRFAWPLMTTQAAENLVLLVINAFLGRLAHPDLALAGYGVAFGLVRLMLSPLRNLTQTAQTLVRTREDLRVILRFSAQVTGFFAALVALLFFTPLRHPILERVMGLQPDLAAYVAPAMLVAIAVTLFWGSSSLFRGLLAAARRTGSLAAAAVGSLLLAMLVGSTTLLLPVLNGAVVGICAMAAAFAQETAILGWSIFANGPLFPARHAEPAPPMAAEPAVRS